MHPEIEKLIDLALADGQVTEKERNVILKKAAELGVDRDEVEMILDGKLHQIHATKNTINTNTKEGIIKKCPHCGASIKAFSEKCEACGEQFRYDTLNSLAGKMQSNTNTLYEISNTLVPINKEAIIEFLTFSIGNVKNKGLSLEVRWAWYAKMEEAFLKADSVMSKDEYEVFERKYYIERLEAKSSINNDTPKTDQQIKEAREADFWAIPGLTLGIFMIYIIVAGLAKWFGGAHLWPF
jgi:hypothetical protein